MRIPGSLRKFPPTGENRHKRPRWLAHTHQIAAQFQRKLATASDANVIKLQKSLHWFVCFSAVSTRSSMGSCPRVSGRASSLIWEAAVVVVFGKKTWLAVEFTVQMVLIEDCPPIRMSTTLSTPIITDPEELLVAGIHWRKWVRIHCPLSRLSYYLTVKSSL